MLVEVTPQDSSLDDRMRPRADLDLETALLRARKLMMVHGQSKLGVWHPDAPAYLPVYEVSANLERTLGIFPVRAFTAQEDAGFAILGQQVEPSEYGSPLAFSHSSLTVGSSGAVGLGVSFTDVCKNLLDVIGGLGTAFGIRVFETGVSPEDVARSVSISLPAIEALPELDALSSMAAAEDDFAARLDEDVTEQRAARLRTRDA